MSKSPSELRLHWPIVLACALGMGAGIAGIPFYTIGLFVEPLQTEFGWSRAQVQFWFSLVLLSGLLFVPMSGWLMDRVGVRWVALPSLLLVAIVYAITSVFTTSLAVFYALAVLLALAGAGTSPLTWTRAVNGWFDRQRGLALGITLTGTGVAAFLAPMYVNKVMALSDWRTAYLALGAVALLALPLVALALREPSAAEASTSARSGATLREALADRRFWLIAVAFFLIAAGIAGAISNLFPLLVDGGKSAGEASRLMGLIGLSVIGGRLLAGFLLDRFWGPAVAAIMLSLPALSAFVLAQPAPGDALLPFAIVLLGLAAGAEFDFIAFLTSRYFGLRHYGKIYGLQYATFSAGAAIASPTFAWVYDSQGSYSLAFYTAAVFFLIGAGLLLLLGPYSDAETQT